MDALSRLFYQNDHAAQARFFSTDVERYASFWDWFLTIRNPFNREHGQFFWEPTFFSNELEFYLLATLTFLHAYRHGSRYLWLWFAILWHGYTVELVSYFLEPIDNFWHAQSTLMFFGKREPFQIVLVYPAYLYCAAIAVRRMNVSELTQACTMAIMVVLMDFPYDIMGIKLLWWTWHDTDSNLIDRNYWVPITSYYFHATFACSFSLIYNYARRHFVGLSSLYSIDELERMPYARRLLASNFWQEFKACACAGLFSMPVGILQFVPLFHYFKDVWGVHAEVTTTALGAIYVLVAFYGVNRARPLNLLEHGEREERKGDKRSGKGRWYYDEVVLAVLIHFSHYMLLVLFANPKTYQVLGLHQTMGSPRGSGDEYDCGQNRTVTYPYPFTPAAFPPFLRADWFQNVTATKRPYLCPNDELRDEGVFNFKCDMARNQTLQPGDKFYWICGTDWNNDGTSPATSHIEYIVVIFVCSIVGLHALIQPLVYPRTLFEQFFVFREFPMYFKYEKPPEERGAYRIVDERIHPKTGARQVCLDRRSKPASKKQHSGRKHQQWVDREEIVQDALGPVYGERGGLYGMHHDTYGKSSYERVRAFEAHRHALDRLSLFDRAAQRPSLQVGVVYNQGYPTPVWRDAPEGDDDDDVGGDTHRARSRSSTPRTKQV